MVVVKRTDLNRSDFKRDKLAILDNSTSDMSSFDIALLQSDFDVGTLEDMGIDIPDIGESFIDEEELMNNDNLQEMNTSKALEGKDITIYGDGKQTRSFCYVDDLVKGLIKMMNSPENITGPINLGNPAEFTIEEFAKLTLQKIPTKSGIVYKPLPKDDPTRRKPDITKAKELLKWQPVCNLSDGLDKTIKYFAGKER